MIHVDDENDLTQKITHWAMGDDDVRVALLTSSRTIPTARVDALSDHDVLLYVTDSDRFGTQDTWLEAFGDILVQFIDPRTHDGMKEYARLVLYKDGTKIDFTIISVEHLHLVLKSTKLPDYLDVGYQVLVDKDHLTITLAQPTYLAHIPEMPTPEEYQALVEEFWWESTYVAKNLWRDELIQARYCLDAVMRDDLLRRMLEWSIEIDHNWSWKPGVMGRGMKQILPTDIWALVEDTFADASIEANWQALFTMTRLFRQIARKVAQHFGYGYPQEMDDGVTRYLEKIQHMEKHRT